MKIKLILEKNPLAQPIKNMSAGIIFANNYIPKYVLEDLPWYERDGLLTYIDQLKYKEFISDSDVAVKNTKVINFDMIHTQCWGTPARILIISIKL